MNKTPTGPTVTLEQKLAVVKHLAKGKNLAFVEAAVPELTAEQICVIGSSHGYPDREKLHHALEALTRQIEERAITLPDSTVDTEISVGRAARLPDARNANRVTRNESTPAAPVAPAPTPAQLTKPDEIRVLLNAGKQSSRKRTQALTDRIFDQIDRLRAALKTEQEAEQAKRQREQQRQEAIAKVRRAEEQLKAARAELRKYKNHPGGNGRPTATAVTDAVQATRKAGGDTQAEALRVRQQERAERLEQLGVTSREIRAWAADNDVDCPAKGRLPAHVVDVYEAAHTKGISAA